MEKILELIDKASLTLGLENWALTLVLWLLFGLVLHFALAYLFRRLHRVAQASEQRWDDVIITALELPLRAVAWVAVLYVAIDIYPGTLGLQDKINPAFDTVTVILLAWLLRRMIRGVEKELLRETHGLTSSTDKAGVRSTAKLLRVVLYILAGIMILQTLGVSISGLLAFGGIGGIAVGFAAKDLLANFFGGLSIYLDKPFTTGDWIRSPDKEIEGVVEEIGWRLTRIRTFDQRPLYVPNAVFSQISVENPSRMRNRRIKETIGIRYQDADKMEVIVEQVHTMLREHDDIEKESRPLIVNFDRFGPSSLDFFIYTFTKTTDWIQFHAIKQDVLLRIIRIVHANGADVAFPTRTLVLENSTSREAAS